VARVPEKIYYVPLLSGGENYLKEGGREAMKGFCVGGFFLLGGWLCGVWVGNKNPPTDKDDDEKTDRRENLQELI